LVVHVIPGRDLRVAVGQLGIGGDDADFLLPGEGALAQHVPTIVELPGIPVGPLLRNMVGSVSGARREVHEEWFVRRQ
jgi:hypothetical protein